MANCQKNTNYLIKDSSGLIRNIRLSSSGKQLEIYSVGSGITECTFDLDSTGFTGLKLIGDNLQIIDAIDGMNSSETSPASRAVVNIKENDASSTLEIIGINDTVMSMQANIRYDSVNDDIIMEH